MTDRREGIVCGARVLITGGLGYLGSRLTDYLFERGITCRVYDPGFFRDGLLCPPAHEPDVMFTDARDIEDRDLEGIDTVVHFAGISNDPFGSLRPERVYDPTREYAARFARLCKARGVRFIFASSCSVYGIGREPLVTEQSATSPQTPYSRNKLEIESDLLAMSDERFAPIMFRFATVFGLSPRIRFDVVINMLAGMAVATGRITLNSNGLAWRPHVHIDDVCQAVWLGITRKPTLSGPLVLNVGDTANNCQVIDVARVVQRAVPGSRLSFLHEEAPSASLDIVRDRKIQDGVDTRTYRVGFDAIRRAFPDFQCAWPISRGIEQLVGQLRALGLTEPQFQDIRFHRLQQLDALFKSGRLTEDVRWAAAEAHAPTVARR